MKIFYPSEIILLGFKVCNKGNLINLIIYQTGWTEEFKIKIL